MRPLGVPIGVFAISRYAIRSPTAIWRPHRAPAGYERTRSMLTESFQVLKDKGHLAPGQEPDRAARATIALGDGLQIQWLLDRTSPAMAEDLRAFLRIATTLDLES